MKTAVRWIGMVAAALSATAFGETGGAPGARSRVKDRERQAQIERNREAWETKKAELEKQRAEWEQKKSEEKARWEAERARTEEKAREVVDQRQANQARRIRHGIQRGFLTAEETARLRSQQETIAQLEKQFTGDGKLSREEFAQLRAALNEASRMIWAEKHDSDGRAMPVYRLGKDVFALDSLTAKLNDSDLSRAEARALLADFRKLLRHQDRLANEDLSEDARAKLQETYDMLLNAYFRAD